MNIKSYLRNPMVEFVSTAD